MGPPTLLEIPLSQQKKLGVFNKKSLVSARLRLSSLIYNLSYFICQFCKNRFKLYQRLVTN